jgi:hypothetical protein
LRVLDHQKLLLLLAVTTERVIGCSEHRRMTMNLPGLPAGEEAARNRTAETTDRQELMARQQHHRTACAPVLLKLASLPG